MHFLHTPPTQKQEENPVIVMLHGRGADENDLSGLSGHLDPRFDIYSLRAPYQYLWGGYTWFELFDDGTVDEKTYQHSTQEVHQFISTLSSKQIFLLGFSMGAMMSYSLALTNPTHYKGIVCMSGFAPPQLEHSYKLSELRHLNIFVSHGTVDPVIPVDFARRTKQLLDPSEAELFYKEYSMGHEITEECITDAAAWLRRLL